MTDDTLFRLRALHEAASPAPWRPCRANKERCVCGIVWVDEETTLAKVDPDIPHAKNTSDAALVAAMRNTLPALLDVAEAAEAMRDHEPWCVATPGCGACAACRFQAALDALRKVTL